MLFSTLYALAVLGDCYLMIFPNGRLFTIIFDAGKQKELGIAFMIIWEQKLDEKRTEMLKHQQELLIGNQSQQETMVSKKVSMLKESLIDFFLILMLL